MMGSSQTENQENVNLEKCYIPKLKCFRPYSELMGRAESGGAKEIRFHGVWEEHDINIGQSSDYVELIYGPDEY